MSKTLKLLGALAALGAVGALIYFASRAKASNIQPLTPPSITELTSKILNAKDLVELDGYYNQIGGLLTAGEITIVEYDQLYTAYVERFYQLTGESA
jgi:hypothetical protein